MINQINFQIFTIESLRNEFSKFGALAKIEIFSKGSNRFAHITFKKSIHAYVATMHFNKGNFDVELVPMEQNFESFQFDLINLPFDCLIKIFKLCNIHSQIDLLNACRRFKKIISKEIFNKQQLFSYSGLNAKQGINAAFTVVQHVNSIGYNINFSTDCMSYVITIDFSSLNRIFKINLSSLTHLPNILDVDILEIDVSSHECVSNLISGKSLKYVHTIKFNGNSKLVCVDLTSLVSLPNIRCLYLKNIWFESYMYRGTQYQQSYFCFKNFLTTFKKSFRFVLEKCKFQSIEEFKDHFVLTDLNENRSVEVYYDEIRYGDNIVINVNEVSFLFERYYFLYTFN